MQSQWNASQIWTRCSERALHNGLHQAVQSFCPDAEVLLACGESFAGHSVAAYLKAAAACFWMCSPNWSCWSHVYPDPAALDWNHWTFQWDLSEMLSPKATESSSSAYSVCFESFRKSLILGNNPVNLAKNLPLLSHLTSMWSSRSVCSAPVSCRWALE